MAKNLWIQQATQHTGVLRARAKKEGKLNADGTIDDAWLQTVSQEPGVWGMRARLAIRLKSFHSSGKKSDNQVGGQVGNKTAKQ